MKDGTLVERKDIREREIDQNRGFVVVMESRHYVGRTRGRKKIDGNGMMAVREQLTRITPERTRRGIRETGNRDNLGKRIEN